MMGNLFYRKVSPTEIELMTFGRMAYWNDWHKMMERTELDAVNND